MREMQTESPRIVVAGAGAIGCYVGGCLALAGRTVTFLGRAKLVDALGQYGLEITDLEGRSRRIAASSVNATDHPQAALRDADIVLVTVKSGGTAEMAATIDRFAPPSAIVVSLQNGVHNAARLRDGMTAKRIVVAGMVPFNVALETDRRPVLAHRATDGAMCLEGGHPGLADVLNVEGMPTHISSDIQAVLWGKLLLNLNNALNALSGLPLAQELSDRRWRRLLAKQMEEALAAMRASGIRPANLAGAPPALLPTILRLPDWLFTRVARRMLAIDPQARSSMFDDLTLRRPTEIDEFQGAILKLAAQGSVQVPATRRVYDAIKAAEAAGAGPPRLSPESLS